MSDDLTDDGSSLSVAPREESSMANDETRDFLGLHSAVEHSDLQDATFDGSSRLVLGDVAAGDPGFVWNYVTDRYARRLHLFAELMLGPKLRMRYTADDLVQETMLKTMKALGEFEYRRPGCFFRWLCTNVRRTALDWNRRADARGGGDVGADQDDDGFQAHLVEADGRAGPATLVRSQDMLQTLLESLEDPRLPRMYAEVLIPLVIEGRDPVEVAAERDVSTETLRRQKNRGLEKWRAILKEKGIEYDTML